jgi:hypothetical protein
MDIWKHVKILINANIKKPPVVGNNNKRAAFFPLRNRNKEKKKEAGRESLIYSFPL